MRAPKAAVLIVLAGLVVALGLRACPRLGAAELADRTQQLIGVLQSNASFFEKARACQQLGEVGGPQAVPVLAGLLDDPKLSAFARSGLEGIPDPSAAAALRKATLSLKGTLLGGVVNSLGVLRDAQATDLLIKLASDSSSGVVLESLMALGNISSPTAIDFLEKGLAASPADSRSTVASAALLAADAQVKLGNQSRAGEIYDLVRKADVSLACRVGATRGAILARSGSERASFLIEQLKSSEPALRNAALLTLREVPDNSLADALNTEVTRSSGDLQMLLLLALADCHNAQSVPVIQTLANGQDLLIRKKALAVLGSVGSVAAPALISALAQDRPVEERTVALNGLKTLRGPEVNDLALQTLTTTRDPSLQADLIRLLDARSVEKASPEIVQLTTSAHKNVVLAALSALKSLAGPNEIPPLVALVKACSDEAVRDAVENSLVGVCTRCGQPCSETVFQELRRASKPAERNFWVRVLAGVGYPPALGAIEEATADSNAEVAGNAVIQLGHWPSLSPMETLLKIMASSPVPTIRQRALGSAMDLLANALDESQIPDASFPGWLDKINSAVQSTQDKRRVLGLLGRVQTLESFRLIVPYLDDSGLRTEASSGIVQIAPALATTTEVPNIKAALKRIAATVDNTDLQQRAIQIEKSLPDASAWVSLFDGLSLSGWEGATNVWRVKDGLIVGGHMSGNPRNEFLATTRSFTNFLLRLEYKLNGTEGFVNSGIQFRSVRLRDPANEMFGYQADIGAGYSGCLYDESRRKTFLMRADEGTVKKIERAGEWNHYEIRAEGAHIQIWLNGKKTVDYSEPDPAIPQNGLIGLQIHGGNKAEVFFRNISVLDL